MLEYFKCNDFVYVYMFFIKNWQKVKKITNMISRIHKFREVVVAELVVHLVLLLKVEYPDTMCHL